MTEKVLGKGLDALIRKNIMKEEMKRKKEKIQKKKENEDPIVTDIKETVMKNPRISLWSYKSAACLKYLKKTVPEFSISSEASLILEEAIKDKYPEVWELFDDEDEKILEEMEEMME